MAVADILGQISKRRRIHVSGLAADQRPIGSEEEVGRISFNSQSSSQLPRRSVVLP